MRCSTKRRDASTLFLLDNVLASKISVVFECGFLTAKCRSNVFVDTKNGFLHRGRAILQFENSKLAQKVLPKSQRPKCKKHQPMIWTTRLDDLVVSLYGKPPVGLDSTEQESMLCYLYAVNLLNPNQSNWRPDLLQWNFPPTVSVLNRFMIKGLSGLSWTVGLSKN